MVQPYKLCSCLHFGHERLLNLKRKSKPVYNIKFYSSKNNNNKDNNVYITNRKTGLTGLSLPG